MHGQMRTIPTGYFLVFGFSRIVIPAGFAERCLRRASPARSIREWSEVRVLLQGKRSSK